MAKVGWWYAASLIPRLTHTQMIKLVGGLGMRLCCMGGGLGMRLGCVGGGLGMRLGYVGGGLGMRLACSSVGSSLALVVVVGA